MDAMIDSGFRGVAIAVWFLMIFIAWRIIKAVFRWLRGLSLQGTARAAGSASAVVKRKAESAAQSFKDGYRS